MSNPTHTPLPWKPSDSGTGIWSAGEPLGKNKIIAICSCDAVSRPRDENTANAAFILRACNSHYELLAALEAQIGDMPDIQGGICQHCGRDYNDHDPEFHIETGACPSDDCPAHIARAAVAKARGLP